MPVYSGMMPGCKLRTGGPVGTPSSPNKVYAVPLVILKLRLRRRAFVLSPLNT